MLINNTILGLDLKFTTKPSSRSLLVDEQSDTWPLLRGNDRKSRHRRIKKQRRYERLAATSQLSLW